MSWPVGAAAPHTTTPATITPVMAANRQWQRECGGERDADHHDDEVEHQRATDANDVHERAVDLSHRQPGDGNAPERPPTSEGFRQHPRPGQRDPATGCIRRTRHAHEREHACVVRGRDHIAGRRECDQPDERREQQRRRDQPPAAEPRPDRLAGDEAIEHHQTHERQRPPSPRRQRSREEQARTN